MLILATVFPIHLAEESSSPILAVCPALLLFSVLIVCLKATIFVGIQNVWYFCGLAQKCKILYSQTLALMVPSIVVLPWKTGLWGLHLNNWYDYDWILRKLPHCRRTKPRSPSAMLLPWTNNRLPLAIMATPTQLSSCMCVATIRGWLLFLSLISRCG